VKTTRRKFIQAVAAALVVTPVAVSVFTTTWQGWQPPPMREARYLGGPMDGKVHTLGAGIKAGDRLRVPIYEKISARSFSADEDISLWPMQPTTRCSEYKLVWCANHERRTDLTSEWTRIADSWYWVYMPASSG
jgi:hypothetical protein